MLIQDARIEGGFHDPVLQAQSVFRAVMNAMARPGEIEVLDQQLFPPDCLSATAAAVACTLIDGDTPVWLDQSLAGSSAVRTWLAFQTGAPFVNDSAQAQFAIASQAGLLLPFDRFALGSQEFPDRSTTIVLQVGTLTRGDGLTLAGPGIRDRKFLAPAPMPARFCDRWSANRALFPRGVDLILAAPDSLACLPRTTRIEAAQGD